MLQKRLQRKTPLVDVIKDVDSAGVKVENVARGQILRGRNGSHGNGVVT